MSARRGQTMVIFALMMLVITLMVLVTLGISSRAHDRMEAQIAADAAAYSEAVLTARTYNIISTINRAQVSEMVGMAATESLISWSGATRGHYTSLVTQLTLAKTLPPASTDPACITAIDNVLNKISSQVNGAWKTKWNQDDIQAGHQAKAIQGTASGMRTWQTDTLLSLIEQLSHSGPTTSVGDSYGTLLGAGTSKDMVKAIVQAANPDLDSANGGDWKSVKEVQDATALTNTSPTTDSVWATMGSRGDPWVTARGAGNGASTQLTNWGVSGFIGGSDTGGSGFGNDMEGSESPGGANSYAAWAHDHAGSVTFNLNCGDGNVVTVTDNSGNAYVYSSEEQQTDDKHVYNGSDVGEPPDVRHTMGACVVCDGIWPFFLDYNASNVDNGANLSGQPVLYAIVHRDYTKAAPDPWNLYFKFKFDKGGSGEVFDNGSKKAVAKVSTSSAYGDQIAISAGLAYYHRYQHAREPPNFFNPFWRATLIPTDADQTNADVSGGTADTVTALQNAGFGPHANALKQLEAAGYKVTELSP